jgi:hypothetical protein
MLMRFPNFYNLNLKSEVYIISFIRSMRYRLTFFVVMCVSPSVMPCVDVSQSTTHAAHKENYTDFGF